MVGRRVDVVVDGGPTSRRGNIIMILLVGDWWSVDELM